MESLTESYAKSSRRKRNAHGESDLTRRRAQNRELVLLNNGVRTKHKGVGRGSH
jgi:hypothetical protein